jgi:hypothetical protein
MGGFIFIGGYGFAGLVCWAVALGMYLSARAGVRGGVPVQGEVYDHSHYVDRGQPMYSPLFRAMVDGGMVTGVGQTATNWKRPAVGTRVDLVYVAGAEVPLREKGVPLATLIACIVLVVVGGGMLSSVAVAGIAMLNAPPSHEPGSTEPPSNASPSPNHPFHPRRHTSAP